MRIAIKAEVIALAILLGISVSPRAQTPSLQSALNLSADQYAALTNSVEQTDPIPADGAPVVGMFYSAQNPALMPLPGNFNNLPAWDLGNMVYLLDDFGFDPRDAFGRRSKEDGSPPPPGDEGGGGGGGYTNTFHYSLDTNGLWLEMTSVSNGLSYLNLHNATNQVYAIWSTTDVMSGWNVETEVWPTNTSVMPFAVLTSNRPNLYMQAEDWTGVTTGTNTIPNWWLWNYFDTLNLSDTDLDANGNTLLTDYANGLDPNIITFSLNVTNQQVNASSAPVQMTVSAGQPYYTAVLLDNVDTSSAIWTPYNQNLVVNLGTTEGWHDVLVGLKGLPANAQQTWEPIRLKLVLNAPSLIVTNPMVGIVTQPFVQLQGYCVDDLACIRYDLSNATSFETNQQAFVTTRQYDTNILDYTTNAFECFDIPLANGTNTITLHARDVAGNVTITNLNYILDPTANTNPPVINVVWPQNSTAISGTTFPILGTISDPFATVTAQIVSDGVTNIVNGLVEQNGSFWIENVPLGDDTSSLTLTATNTAGYGSATDITLTQSTVALTITSVTFNDPESPTATVTGTLSGSSDTVFVNGVEATNSGSGTWTAYFVPVGESGTATITAEALAGSPGGGGSGGGISGGAPAAAEAQVTEDIVRAPGIARVDCHAGSVFTETAVAWADCNPFAGAGFWEDLANWTLNWTYGSPGKNISTQCEEESYHTSSYFIDEAQWDANGNGVSTNTLANACGDVNMGTVTSYLAPYQNYVPYYGEEANWQSNGPLYTSCTLTFTKNDNQYQDEQRWVLRTGGQAVPGQVSLWVITANANYGTIYSPGDSIPSSQITVAGQTLNANGQVYLALPNNSPPIDVGPKAPPNQYLTGESFNHYPLHLYFNGEDTSGTNPTVLVGQKISLTCGLGSGAPAITSYQWTVPGNVISNFYISPDPLQTNGYPVPFVNSNGPEADFYWVDGGQYKVQCMAQVSNQTVSAVATFVVIKPTAQLSATIEGTVGIIANAGLWFDYIFPGIAFFENNESVDGDWELVQLGSASYGRQEAATGQWYIGQGAGLDTAYPYPVTDGTDSPHSVGLDASMSQANGYGSFTMYLTFEPPGSNSIRIPIRQLHWNWSGTATNNGGTWTASGTATNDLGDAPAPSTISWTNNITNTINNFQLQ